MKPQIDGTCFGWIEIDGTRYEHDVLIRLDGAVKKREKKLSEAVYGTSHTLSLDEAKHIYEKGTSHVVVGTGQSGVLELSDEASAYFERKGVAVELLPTPEAVRSWNEAKGPVIGLFHVTC
jgi:hypothetical protein